MNRIVSSMVGRFAGALPPACSRVAGSGGRRWGLGLVLLCWAGSTVGCERRVDEGGAPASSGGTRDAASQPLAPTPPEVKIDPATLACEAEWKRVLDLPPLPGAPALMERRVEILGRAKAAPVILRRAPGADEAVSERVARLRSIMLESKRTLAGLAEVFRRTLNEHPVRRSAILREGYLYAERPALAARFANSVRLDHLFREKHLRIERGDATISVEWKQQRYVYADGPEEGHEARILYLDRVSVADEEVASPLHFDVRKVRDELGFGSMNIVHLVDDRALAEFRYGVDGKGPTTRAVLNLEGPKAALQCEIVPATNRPRVEELRATAHRNARAFAPMKRVIDEMVDEELPFDEPRTEEGQQDGRLRPEWNNAYTRGRRKYEFNGDRYFVFDPEGRPIVPQVCIDFITDVFERAAGGWWTPRNQRRQRTPGTLRFRSYDIDNPRSVESFERFAAEVPEWFDVIRLPKEERVPFRKREAFFQHIAEHIERYQVGDIIFIYGLRDDEKFHYHSFFIYESDPVTGAPILVAANAGRPRIQSWEQEMNKAPRRFIVSRVRPRVDWLEAAFTGKTPLAPPVRVAKVEESAAGPEGASPTLSD